MTATVVTRAQAGLPPLPSGVSTNITPQGDTVHYGGGSPWGGKVRVAGDADHNRCASIWRAWRDYHVNGNKWADIAYSHGVCPHGFVFEGRGKGRRTAANGTNDGNQRSYAICYIAGDGDHFTEEARRAYHDAAGMLGQPLRWKHKDWLSTGCPGRLGDEWVAAGFPMAAGPAPAPAPAPTPRPQPLPPSAAPPFPLGAGQYFGPKTGGSNSISGYYQRLSNGRPGHPGLLQWQQRMAERGWRIGDDGLYGDETARVAKGIQRQVGLREDGLIGPYTFRVAWTAPVS